MNRRDKSPRQIAEIALEIARDYRGSHRFSSFMV